MPFVIIDHHTVASGRVNEDRAGGAHDSAWVIDGATDVIAQPLTHAATDADWIAGRLDAALTALSATWPVDISRLPDLVAARLAAEFAASAKRAPHDKTEHPSAAAIIVRNCNVGFDYVSIGDCTLLAEGSSGFVRIGVDEADAGDPNLAKILADLHAEHDGLEAEAARAQVLPSVKAGRAAMNEPNGYGVFSITPTPTHFVHDGQLAMLPGGHVLLASDGLMRLVDVFGLYSAPQLLETARNKGLQALLQVLRKVENDDVQGHRHPRAKIHDDATGLLLRWTP